MLLRFTISICRSACHVYHRLPFWPAPALSSLFFFFSSSPAWRPDATLTLARPLSSLFPLLFMRHKSRVAITFTCFAPWVAAGRHLRFTDRYHQHEYRQEKNIVRCPLAA